MKLIPNQTKSTLPLLIKFSTALFVVCFHRLQLPSQGLELLGGKLLEGSSKRLHTLIAFVIIVEHRFNQRNDSGGNRIRVALRCLGFVEGLDRLRTEVLEAIEDIRLEVSYAWVM